MDFNKRELELLLGSVANFRDDLEKYIAWIDDRPMLPAREAAIATVKAEIKELLNLQLKLYHVATHLTAA